MNEIRNYACPLCGMPMGKEQQVCSQCSDKIKWGESIEEYCFEHGGKWYNYEIEKPTISGIKYKICIVTDCWNGMQGFSYRNEKFVDNDFKHGLSESIVSWFKPSDEIYFDNIQKMNRRIIEHIAETKGISLTAACNEYYNVWRAICEE